MHGRAIGRKATCLARLGDYDAAIACLDEQRDGAAGIADLEAKIAEVVSQQAAFAKVRGCSRLRNSESCQMSCSKSAFQTASLSEQRTQQAGIK